MTQPYITSPLTPADAKAGFSSGVHPLDDFFRRHALTNQEAGVSNTFVLRSQQTEGADQDGTPTVLGFYTLSMTSLPSASVAPHISSKLPRYDMPAALIGRLAVHRDAQRRGFGERLLIDAINRVLEVSQAVGCVGVVVDAKDARAVAFYSAYSFNVIAPGVPTRMFVPLATLRSSRTP